MGAKPNRSINNREADVIRAALERASVSPEASVLAATVSGLRVVDQCGCGCDSVDFEKDPNERSRPIADGTGTTPSGGGVGVIVWGTSIRITGLEVYDLGAGDGGLRLPEPSSILPWNTVNRKNRTDPKQGAPHRAPGERYPPNE
jgi:hypothetical protein